MEYDTTNQYTEISVQLYINNIINSHYTNMCHINKYRIHSMYAR